jgi:hypothetical protein
MCGQKERNRRGEEDVSGKCCGSCFQGKIINRKRKSRKVKKDISFTDFNT